MGDFSKSKNPDCRPRQRLCCRPASPFGMHALKWWQKTAGSGAVGEMMCSYFRCSVRTDATGEPGSPARLGSDGRRAFPAPVDTVNTGIFKDLGADGISWRDRTGRSSWGLTACPATFGLAKLLALQVFRETSTEARRHPRVCRLFFVCPPRWMPRSTAFHPCGRSSEPGTHEGTLA